MTPTLRSIVPEPLPQQGPALRAGALGILDPWAQRLGAILDGTRHAAIARAVREGDGFRTDAQLRVARLRGKTEAPARAPKPGPVLSLAALRRV